MYDRNCGFCGRPLDPAYGDRLNGMELCSEVCFEITIEEDEDVRYELIKKAGLDIN